MSNTTETLPESSVLDFQIEDHGSIVLVRPLNQDLRAHLEENTGEEAQWFGGALVVEPRYLEGLVERLEENGYSFRP